MSDFSLTVPSEDEIKENVVNDVKPSEEQVSVISTETDKKVNEIMSVDLDSFENRKELTSVFENFGNDIVVSSQNKNDILQKRMVVLEKQDGLNGEVSKGLEDLTIKMRDLDPSGIDFVKTGKLGKIFNPARRYFERFKSADDEISEIIKSLDKGKKTLLNDNVTLELEQSEMRKLTKNLTSAIEMGTQLDSKISNATENLKLSGTEPDKVKFIEEELLYPLRQRIMDFEQLLTVNQQGIIAMEIIRRNNRELIASVERAKMVSVNALRTAVMTATALYDQKIVLEKVNAVNDATNNMIAATSKMLHEQGVEIQKQASDSAISVDVMKNAFTETLQALDDISTFKQAALPKMKETIVAFQEMANEGEKHIQNMEKSNSLTK